MSELWRHSVVELAACVRSRKVSAEEVCLAFLDRATTVDTLTNCFVSLEDEGALAAARAVDRRLREGRPAPSLAGVPYAAKDIFAAADRRPGAGARSGAGPHLRATSSPVLERLDAAGAVCLGRLNLDPWAYATTGANPDLGDTLNPWDLAHLAGGSSSGSAAAVAARAVPFALGSDTGGSTRIPAALCGVVGLKPTFGRISRRGTVPLSFSQDTIGVLARSAGDLALVLEQIAAYDRLDPASISAPAGPYLSAAEAAAAGDRPLDGLRIGIDQSRFDTACEQQICSLAVSGVNVLAEAGAALVEVDLGALVDLDVVASVLTQAESASLHRAAVRERPADFAPAVRLRICGGLACQGSDHVDALRYQGYALRELLEGPLSQVELLAAPVTGRTAPRRAELAALDETRAVAASLEMLSLNRPFSLVGVPAVSLPIGFASDGLPVGLQLVARPWCERQLIKAIAAYQAVTDWHLRVPDLPLPQPVEVNE